MKHNVSTAYCNAYISAKWTLVLRCFLVNQVFLFLCIKFAFKSLHSANNFFCQILSPLAKGETLQ